MSTINVVYGFSFNFEKIDTESADVVYDFELPEGVELITGHSCSSFEPSEFMIGFNLQDIRMFQPTTLKPTPITKEMTEILEDIEFPWEPTKSPEITIFGSDDN